MKPRTPKMNETKTEWPAGSMLFKPKGEGHNGIGETAKKISKAKTPKAVAKSMPMKTTTKKKK